MKGKAKQNQTNATTYIRTQIVGINCCCVCVFYSEIEIYFIDRVCRNRKESIYCQQIRLQDTSFTNKLTLCLWIYTCIFNCDYSTLNVFWVDLHLTTSFYFSVKALYKNNNDWCWMIGLHGGVHDYSKCLHG